MTGIGGGHGGAVVVMVVVVMAVPSGPTTATTGTVGPMEPSISLRTVRRTRCASFPRGTPVEGGRRVRPDPSSDRGSIVSFDAFPDSPNSWAGRTRMGPTPTSVRTVPTGGTIGKETRSLPRRRSSTRRRRAGRPSRISSRTRRNVGRRWRRR